MFDLQTVSVLFYVPKKHFSIRAFRGAIGALVGDDKVAYHQHLPDVEGRKQYQYDYPLVQYRKLSANLAQILFIGKATEQIKHIFGMGGNPSLMLEGEQVRIRIRDMRMDTHTLQYAGKDTRHVYKLSSWLGLPKPEIEQAYLHAPDAEAQKRVLENQLAGNIFKFAHGVDWYIKEQGESYSVQIEQVGEPVIVSPKPQFKTYSFDLTFSTELCLPPVGLGKLASFGYGRLSGNI
jgi:hypothetical protein